MNKIKAILLIALTAISLVCNARSADVFIEAESFTEKGGWVLDQQFMDQMGSPYLMAHGLGKVVADARTTVEFPETGTYRLWVRTFNWTAPWYKGAGPGQFKLKINGKTHPVVLGNTGEQWMWQDAGKVSVKNKQTEIALQDLTGFNGRCDAIFFTKDESFVPPSNLNSLSEFRRNKLGIEVKNTKQYDLVVVGGGIAGICAAVSAGRLGLTVALINDRPVLGGNNSSEIRVGLINDLPIYGGNHGSIPFGLSGDNDYNLYPNLGNVMREIAVKMERHYYNAGPPKAYIDDEKLAMVQQTPHVDLYLNMHVFKTEMNQNTITAVVARHIENSTELRFEGNCFADCTGDATVGYLAGADYRMGREGTYEALETLAPTIADNAKTGTSNLWTYETSDVPSTFPVLDWACQMNPDFYVEGDKDWRWEGGFNKNTITEAENIRDHNFRAIFGNWSYVKNNIPKFANRQISWLAYIAGKRESRRLLGDVILNQNDIQNQVQYSDASFTTTWPLDLHYPDPKNSKYFPGEEFFSYCVKTYFSPYHVPYRCLYSRNINNLFMAGRNISVTHVAFGTIRIQQQTGMMGEVVGIAASLCKKYNIAPRQVYTEHLAGLKSLMKTGVPTTMVNVAKNKPVIYSDVSLTDNTGQMPAFWVKFGNTPRWVSNNLNTEHWMEIDLQGTYAVNACKIWRGTNVKQFRLQAKVNGTWVDVVSEDNDNKSEYYKEFKRVSTDKVRFYVPAYSNNGVRLSNIEVYSINPLNNIKEPQIDANFPGGNMKVLSINGDSVKLLQELRGSSHDEIYWSFRIRGAEGRTLHFTLLPWSISTRGPAVSKDGINWHWLSDKTGFAADKFDYSFKQDEKEVYFSQCINYTEKNLNLFLEKHKGNPALKVETLCKSEKGRNVELLRIGEHKNASFKVYLSSRHHCNETMGTYAMEGIIETILSDTKDGKWLREHCDFFVVPFVDKDGVEEGDQGKNRKPHDHNRDYIQRKYHSVQAITEQVPKWADGKPLFLLDLHCPWLRGGDDPLSAKVLEYTNRETNEYFYFVGQNSEKLTNSLQRYGEILEKERKGVIPFKVSNILSFGKGWNIASNIKAGMQSCGSWGTTLPNVIFSSSTEIPFANAEGVVVDANSARALGRDLAHAIRVYLEGYHE